MEPKRNRKPRYNRTGIFTHFYEDYKYLYTGVSLEILAFIQYTVDEGLHLTSYEHNIISHCSEWLHVSISIKQIEAKLLIFWVHGSSENRRPSDWREIYAKGVNVLPRLPEDKRERARARARELKELLAFDSSINAKQQTQKTSSASNSTNRRIRKRQKRRDPWIPTQKKTRTTPAVSPRKLNCTKS